MNQAHKIARTISSLIYEASCLKFVNRHFYRYRNTFSKLEWDKPNNHVTLQSALHGGGFGLEMSPAPCGPEP